MKTGFDPRAYADLWVEYLHFGIETEEENERLTQAAGRLMKKGKDRLIVQRSRLPIRVASSDRMNDRRKISSCGRCRDALGKKSIRCRGLNQHGCTQGHA